MPVKRFRWGVAIAVSASLGLVSGALAARAGATPAAQASGTKTSATEPITTTSIPGQQGAPTPPPVDPADLAALAKQSPFTVRVPTLDAQFVLVNLGTPSGDYLANPSSGAPFSIDQGYESAQQQVIHIWESNIPAASLGAKDPTTLATQPASVNGWRSGSLGPGDMFYAKRYSDGVTIEVDTNISDASSVLESLDAVGP